VLVTGFPAGPPGTNCYVVAPGPGSECVIIDPGIAAERRLPEVVSEHRLKPVAVLLTHGHFDHTFAVVPVCDGYDIPAYIHPLDRHQLTDPWAGIGAPRGANLFGLTEFTEPSEVRALSGDEELDLAGVRVRVHFAPGHTPGQVVFTPTAIDGVEPEQPLLLSGDLLFAGSIGRTDLPGGDENAMFASLARVVLPLPDETVVLPGHGPETTVEAERARNPYLRMAAVRAGSPGGGRG